MLMFCQPVSVPLTRSKASFIVSVANHHWLCAKSFKLSDPIFGTTWVECTLLSLSCNGSNSTITYFLLKCIHPYLLDFISSISHPWSVTTCVLLYLQFGLGVFVNLVHDWLLLPVCWIRVQHSLYALPQKFFRGHSESSAQISLPSSSSYMSATVISILSAHDLNKAVFIGSQDCHHQVCYQSPLFYQPGRPIRFNHKSHNVYHYQLMYIVITSVMAPISEITCLVLLKIFSSWIFSFLIFL